MKDFESFMSKIRNISTINSLPFPKNHLNKISPKAFPLLMGIEFCERFSYYSMNFLLVLFAADTLKNHGLGWSKTAALQLAGIFGAAGFILPVFGSYFADRLWGQKKTALLGAAIMTFAYGLLGSHSQFIFLSALFLSVIGSGFFKACIPAMISQIFEGKDLEKSNAYSTYYMAINLGIISAGFSTGYLQLKYGYHTALAFAAVGTGIAFTALLIGKHTILKPLGNGMSLKNQDSKPIKSIKQMLTESKQSRNKYKVYLFMTFFFLLKMSLYFVIINGSLVLYLKQNVDLTLGNFQIPVTWIPGFCSFSLVLASLVWNRLFSYLKVKKNKNVSVPVKAGAGLLLLALSFFIISADAYPLAHAHHHKISAVLWPFLVFYVLTNFAHILVAPTVLHTSNDLVPKSTESFHSAVFFAVMGVGYYVASWVGHFIFTMGGFLVFLGIGVMMAGMGIVHLVAAKKLQEWAGET